MPVPFLIKGEDYGATTLKDPETTVESLQVKLIVPVRLGDTAVIITVPWAELRIESAGRDATWL